MQHLGNAVAWLLMWWVGRCGVKVTHPSSCLSFESGFGESLGSGGASVLDLGPAGLHVVRH